MRLLRTVLGIFFLFLGLVGLFLPVLQGLLFLGIGVLLIGKDTLLGRWITRQILRFRPGRKGKHPEKRLSNGSAPGK